MIAAAGEPGTAQAQQLVSLPVAGAKLHAINFSDSEAAGIVCGAYGFVQLGLPAATKGVVITRISPTSGAAEAGLQPGDVVQEVNRERITSVADFDRTMRRLQGRTLLLFVNRQGQTGFFAIDPR